MKCAKEKAGLEEVIGGLSRLEDINRIEVCAYYSAQNHIYRQAAQRLAREEKRILRHALDDIFRTYIKAATHAKEVCREDSTWSYYAHTVTQAIGGLPKRIRICGEKFRRMSLHVELRFNRGRSVALSFDEKTSTYIITNIQPTYENARRVRDYLRGRGWQ